MRRVAMLAVLVDDYDFVRGGDTGKLSSLNRACTAAVLEADMVIHAQTGRIYKSRYTSVPEPSQRMDAEALIRGVRTPDEIRWDMWTDS